MFSTQAEGHRVEALACSTLPPIWREAKLASLSFSFFFLKWANQRLLLRAPDV